MDQWKENHCRMWILQEEAKWMEENDVVVRFWLQKIEKWRMWKQWWIMWVCNSSTKPWFLERERERVMGLVEVELTLKWVKKLQHNTREYWNCFFVESETVRNVNFKLIYSKAFSYFKFFFFFFIFIFVCFLFNGLLSLRNLNLVVHNICKISVWTSTTTKKKIIKF